MYTNGLTDLFYPGLYDHMCDHQKLYDETSVGVTRESWLDYMKALYSPGLIDGTLRGFPTVMITLCRLLEERRKYKRRARGVDGCTTSSSREQSAFRDHSYETLLSDHSCVVAV
jgi:hypothetical protein